MSPTGVPLQDAAILLGSSPYTELARTNKSGHFTMSESCESLSYTVTKNDYIPHRLQSARQPDAHPLLIRLEDAGLSFTLVYIMNNIRNRLSQSPFSVSRWSSLMPDSPVRRETFLSCAIRS